MKMHQQILDYALKNHFQVEEVVGTDIQVFTKNGKQRFVIGEYLPMVPYNIGLILGNRYFTQKVLQDAKLCIPQSAVFSSQDLSRAVAFAQKILFPISLKLENANAKGDELTTIYSLKQLIEAFETLSKVEQNVLIEKQLQGNEYQVFLSDTGFIQVLEKVRTHENVISFVEAGKKVDFQTNSFAYMDVTGQASRQLKKIAKKVLLTFPGLKYVSFTMFAKDETCHEYVIEEVRHLAEVHYEYLAQKGRSHKPVLDIITNSFERLFEV